MLDQLCFGSQCFPELFFMILIIHILDVIFYGSLPIPYFLRDFDLSILQSVAVTI